MDGRHQKIALAHAILDDANTLLQSRTAAAAETDSLVEDILTRSLQRTRDYARDFVSSLSWASRSIIGGLLPWSA